MKKYGMYIFTVVKDNNPDSPMNTESQIKELQEMLEKYVGVGWRTIDGDRGLLTIKVDREKLGRHAGRQTSIDIDVKYQDILDMRAEGMTHAQIIEKIGWSRASYFRAWKNRDGLKPENPFSYGKSKY